MAAGSTSPGTLPLWLKTAYSAWMLLWVPSYAAHYGPQNFLWLCDIANFLVLVALWTESRLLLSSQLVAVLVVDLVWTFDLAAALITGMHPVGGTEYMLDSARPLFIRMLSLFHLFVPLLLFGAVIRTGFLRTGILFQTAITWIILPVTFLVTDPEKNINWAFGPFGSVQDALPPVIYLLILMAAYPLLLYLPAQGIIIFLERRFFPRRSS